MRVVPIEGSSYIGGSTVFSNQTFDANIDSELEDGKAYIFENCTFNTAVSSTKKVSLTFNNCTFKSGYTGIGGNKCIYLTSVTNLIVDGCSFEGSTSAGELPSSAGYALDLNLYSTDCKNIIIRNNDFNTLSSEQDNNVAISIKTRLGETEQGTDRPTDLPSDATAGTISGEVLIEGNTFTEDCAKIYLGTNPKGDRTDSNTSTGAFKTLVQNNNSTLSIYLRYSFSKTEEEQPTIIEAGVSAVYGYGISE